MCDKSNVFHLVVYCTPRLRAQYNIYSKSNQYEYFTCSDVTRCLFCQVNMHSCYGVSIITRKPAAFAQLTAETAVDEIGSKAVIQT